jgi:hypothetical protein
MHIDLVINKKAQNDLFRGTPTARVRVNADATISLLPTSSPGGDVIRLAPFGRGGMKLSLGGRRVSELADFMAPGSGLSLEPDRYGWVTVHPVRDGARGRYSGRVLRGARISRVAARPRTLEAA